MLIAIVVLLSLIACYFALGLQVLAIRSLFVSDELGHEDFACWPYLLIADGFVLLIHCSRKLWLRSIRVRASVVSGGRRESMTAAMVLGCLIIVLNMLLIFIVRVHLDWLSAR